MRRAALVGLGLGVATLVVADALAARAGLVAGLVPRADGPGPWVISRAAGVTAFVALSLDVMFGLFLSTGAADRWIPRARSVEVHRWLSSATLALIALHVLALLGDGFARFDILDVFVPFLIGYRPVAVALGSLAAYLALAVHLSFEFRGRIGARAWRRVHHLTFATFVLATGHGILGGSDAEAPWVQVIYAGSVTAVAALGILRAVAAWHVRRGIRPSLVEANGR